MSLPSLYELADEFQEALESLTDLDDQSVKDTLESIEGEFQLKTTNVAKYIKNLEHTANGIKEVESRQHKRRTSIESKIKHLKEYLRYNLEKTNTQKVESSEITITIQNNPHNVVITNEKDIPNVPVSVPHYTSLMRHGMQVEDFFRRKQDRSRFRNEMRVEDDNRN